MNWPAPIRLQGLHATLEPLSLAHADALCDAVRDGELWKLWYTSVATPEGMPAEIERRLALQVAGAMLPFTSFDTAGRAIQVGARGLSSCQRRCAATVGHSASVML